MTELLVAAAVMPVIVVGSREEMRGGMEAARLAKKHWNAYGVLVGVDRTGQHSRRQRHVDLQDMGIWGFKDGKGWDGLR